MNLLLEQIKKDFRKNNSLPENARLSESQRNEIAIIYGNEFAKEYVDFIDYKDYKLADDGFWRVNGKGETFECDDVIAQLHQHLNKAIKQHGISYTNYGNKKNKGFTISKT